MPFKESTTKKTPVQGEEKAGAPVMPSSKENRIMELLEKNLEMAEKNLWFNERIMRWIFWQKVRSWFYLLLIIAPLILAAVYLPPILKDFYSQYDNLWTMIIGQKSNDELNITIDPEQLEQFKKLQNSGSLK